VDDVMSLSHSGLNSAIENTIADVCQENGWMPDGFIGLVNFIDEDGKRCWFEIRPNEQFFDKALGMVDHLYQLNRAVQRINLRDAIRRNYEDSADGNYD
jgi:hypothetical protein